LVYLQKESNKWQNQSENLGAALQKQKSDILIKAISNANSTVAELEGLNESLKNIDSQLKTTGNAVSKKIIELTLQTKLDKARVNAVELLLHLETKATETKKSKAHYEELMKNILEVNARLSNMDASVQLAALDRELASIEGAIVPIKKQAPYTLLMMRIVEIGLPLFLSIFSVFFVLRYTLTEKRSHEIKELLRIRNMERL
jgi:hypothetical protein